MNVQIFAFTDCPDFKALLEVECRELTGLKPVIHTSLDELKGMLNLFQSLEILVVDEPEDRKSCEELKQFLTGTQNRIKRIFILGENLKLDKVRNYTRMDIANFFEDLRNFINPTKLTSIGWMAIPLNTLLHFEQVPFDLYLKISRERFVKRIPAFETIDRSLLIDLQKRSVSELFCDKKYSRDFSMMLINNMINKIEKGYERVDEKLKASNEVFLTTKEIVQHLGISSRVIEVCESAIERITVDIAGAKDQFGNYIRNLKESPELAFQYKLIELTSFISGQLIHGMNYFAKEEQIKKLVFASFFCDITLTNPNHLMIRKSEELEKLPLNEHNEVGLHALKASELVATYRNTPKEVAIIVRQHHGSFSGMGMPTRRSTELLPLSKVFMISQDLAFDILTDGKNSSMQTLRTFVNSQRASGLSDILKVLEGMLKEESTLVA